MSPRINGLGIMPEDTRICVVMVGLPARGKSYIAQRGESPDPKTTPTPAVLLRLVRGC